MSLVKRLLIILFVFATCVGCDHSTKVFAESRLSGDQSISLLSNTIRLQIAHNEGSFLSLGATASPVWRAASLRIGVAAMLLGLFAYALAAKSIGVVRVSALALVFAGGASNLIDRFVNDGYVVDFLNLGIGQIRTGIFNIADVAITLGFLILLAQSWRGQRRDA
jgi:signal peptidase II